MNEVANKEFNHIKIHTQYSICEGALRTADKPSRKIHIITNVETAKTSLKNISVTGCHVSKRTSAAGKPAANKNIEIKAKLFPATSRLPEANGTLKTLLLSKNIF